MFPGLLNSSGTINRKQKVGTNGRTGSPQALHSNVPCLVMPMGHQTAVEHGFSLGHAYDIYLNQSQDVRPADQMVVNGSTYTVKYVQSYTVPFAGYTLALCEQELS